MPYAENPTPRPGRRSPFAPDVVYSPIVPALQLATNRSDPDTAMPVGEFNPETREAFTTAPDVVYSPIVPLPFEGRDKKVRPRHGNAQRIIQPREQGGVHDCSRRGVFANRAVALIRRQIGPIQTRQCKPAHSTPKPGRCLRCSRRGVFANRAVAAIRDIDILPRAVADESAAPTDRTNATIEILRNRTLRIDPLIADLLRGGRDYYVRDRTCRGLGHAVMWPRSPLLACH